MADVVASSPVFASTDGLREIWDVTSEVAAGTALINDGRAGVAYTRGSGIDYRHAGASYNGFLGTSAAGGKHWERDMIVRYTVQNGHAKGLALQLRWSMHRANAAQGEPNVNQVRLLAEMPVRVF